MPLKENVKGIEGEQEEKQQSQIVATLLAESLTIVFLRRLFPNLDTHLEEPANKATEIHREQQD